MSETTEEKYMVMQQVHVWDNDYKGKILISGTIGEPFKVSSDAFQKASDLGGPLFNSVDDEDVLTSKYAWFQNWDYLLLVGGNTSWKSYWLASEGDADLCVGIRQALKNEKVLPEMPEKFQLLFIGGPL